MVQPVQQQALQVASGQLPALQQEHQVHVHQHLPALHKAEVTHAQAPAPPETTVSRTPHLTAAVHHAQVQNMYAHKTPAAAVLHQAVLIAPAAAVHRIAATTAAAHQEVLPTLEEVQAQVRATAAVAAQAQVIAEEAVAQVPAIAAAATVQAQATAAAVVTAAAAEDDNSLHQLIKITDKRLPLHPQG